MSFTSSSNVTKYATPLSTIMAQLAYEQCMQVPRHWSSAIECCSQKERVNLQTMVISSNGYLVSSLRCTVLPPVCCTSYPPVYQWVNGRSYGRSYVRVYTSVYAILYIDRERFWLRISILIILRYNKEIFIRLSIIYIRNYLIFLRYNYGGVLGLGFFDKILDFI